MARLLSRLLLASLLLSLALGADYPEDQRSPYRRRMEEIYLKVNQWRQTPSLIEAYKTNSWDLRKAIIPENSAGGNFVCFDKMSVVKQRNTDGVMKCHRKGMVELGTGWETTFGTEVNNAKSPSLPMMKWSEELAYSAGKFVESLAGCNIYPPNIVNPEHEHKYLNEVVDYFEDHRRIILVPE